MVRYDGMKKYGDMCQLVRDSGKYAEGHAIHRFGSDTAVVFGDNTIAVDGSDNFREWASNFAFLRFGKNGTHAGFAVAAERLFEKVKGLVQKDKIFYLTGHSRGGAIAQLLAMKLAEAGCYCHVITFGSPKVGGTRFRRRMAELCISHVRVEMEGDPVCRLPMWWKHYATDTVYIQNKERGVDCHTKYWEYI